jgi:hypothetical protein
MATPGRLQDPPVENRRTQFADLERVLREQPFSFDFFQSVRLLGRILSEPAPISGFRPARSRRSIGRPARSR